MTIYESIFRLDDGEHNCFHSSKTDADKFFLANAEHCKIMRTVKHDLPYRKKAIIGFLNHISSHNRLEAIEEKKGA